MPNELSKSAEIENDTDLHRVYEEFKTLLAEATGIMRFLVGPYSPGEILHSENINSTRLKNIADRLDDLHGSLHAYTDSKYQQDPRNLDGLMTEINLGGAVVSEITRKFEMYGIYLEDRNNPQTLYADELKRVKPRDRLGEYYIEKDPNEPRKGIVSGILRLIGLSN